MYHITKWAPWLALHRHSLVRPLFFHESATMSSCSSGGQIHEAAFSNQSQLTVASPKTLKAISLKSITWHLTLHPPPPPFPWASELLTFEADSGGWRLLFYSDWASIRGPNRGANSCYTCYRASGVVGQRSGWSHIESKCNYWAQLKN